MQPLTLKEIDYLLQAIDALKSQRGSSLFTGALLGAVFSKTKEEAEKVIEKMKKDMDKTYVEQQEMFEDLDILKSKLIQMKRDLQNEEIHNLGMGLQ